MHTYPHDRDAFTEGLFYLDGYLYESTGAQRAVADPQGGPGDRPGRCRAATSRRQFFGEGIVAWKGRLIQLTWQNQIGFIYDLATFQPLRQLHLHRRGLGADPERPALIMSDGTPQLRFLDPATLKETGRLTVTADGVPVKNLNELEWVKGEILRQYLDDQPHRPHRSGDRQGRPAGST